MSGGRWMLATLHGDWCAMWGDADALDAEAGALRARADRWSSRSRGAAFVLWLAGGVGPDGSAVALVAAGFVVMLAGVATWLCFERRAWALDDRRLAIVHRWAEFARVVDVAAAMRGRVGQA